MLSVAFFDTDDEGNCAMYKELRDRSSPLELPEYKFRKMFRVSKEGFKIILNEIKHELPKTGRSSSVPNYLKLCCALRFLAEGSYQRGVGCDYNVGLSQSSVSKVLTEVINAMEKQLCPKWIKFKKTEARYQDVKHAFFEKTGFPGIIGCVDGTHVNIVRPHADEHLYYNRKGNHSLNVMIACDHNMFIDCVDARFGGSSHDSFIWSLSDYRKHLEQEHQRGRRNNWLLGDSGYPLEPWLITPYRTSREGSSEATFNKKHSVARNIIERTIGLLKSRFRCLLKQRELYYAPRKASQITNVCVALHNICLQYRITLDPEDVIHIQEDNTISEVYSDNSPRAHEIRNQIMNTIC